MDRVDTCASAGVPADRAPASRRSFLWGIVYLVADAVASALEGVVEADPVTRFVSQRLQAGIPHEH